MVTQDDDSKALESRPPQLADLVGLCKKLNDEKAQYIVVGGMAMINQGFTRATEDIDLLIESSENNFAKIKKVLMTLPDQAAQDLNAKDMDQYLVIRVADEIVVDLMQVACGVDYSHAKSGITVVKISDVEIPFASTELMIELKQGVRAKDKMDLEFLRALKNRINGS